MKRLGCLLAVLATVPTAPVAASPEPDVGEPPEARMPAPEWGSCASFVDDTSDIPAARCAVVAVPVDYRHPDGEQAQLAVIRIPATGERIGSLLLNPGGPGAPAVDLVATLAPQLEDTEIGERFDLVGFDPRGVGHSRPAVRCRTDAEFDAYRREPQVDMSPSGVSQIEGLNRQLAGECADRMGTDFLANVGTASAARDMDRVRQALGDEQLNYLGFSYGTRLGTAYLERFADHVRTMVLDGALDPTVDPIDHDINQMSGFQRAFDDYAADCAQSPDCPLGADPARAVVAYHQLVDSLVDDPAPTSDQRGLSYGDAITGTINALYNPGY